MHETFPCRAEYKKLFDAVCAEQHPLPAESYTSDHYHRLEISHIYAACWAAIGFVSEFKAGRAAKPITFLGKPLVVTRNDDGDIQVFENVCRHRGHLLIEQDLCGKKLLTCPYHAWCYDLNGQFVAAPYWDGTKGSAPGPQTRQKLDLVPVRFEIWYDLIFVNLDGQAQPFDRYRSELEARWARFRPASRLRNFSHKSYSLDGNWKLAAENFLDNYHLPWIHPEVSSSMEGALGLTVENIRLADNIIGFSHPSAGRDKGKTAKALPGWPDLEGNETLRQDLFFMFPNTCFVMEGYYLWSMILLPTGAGTCDEKLALYVVGDEAMGTEFDASRQQLEDLIYNINNQDSRVIKSLQAGRQSSAASAGVYCDRHDQLGKWFHQAVAGKMLPHL